MQKSQLQEVIAAHAHILVYLFTDLLPDKNFIQVKCLFIILSPFLYIARTKAVSTGRNSYNLDL